MPLTDADKKKYKALYLQTAKPYVTDLQKIASLQDDDTQTIEIIHRAAHSLGSQSLMMDYNSLGGLSRLIEKIFKSKMDDGYILTQETKDVLVKSVARISDSITAIEQQDVELDLSSEMEELHTVSKIAV
jgi:chemotaxis protein histidine kinase CheA